MPRHIEEEIKGPSESASQGLFAHQISRLGRQVKLPKRFEQNTEVLPTAKSGVRNETFRKRSIQKQPTISIYEDKPLVDEAESKHQPPIPPAKEFQVEVDKTEPEWVKNFNRAKKRVDKYSVLDSNISHLRDNSFPEKISIPERCSIVNLPSTVSADRPDSIFSLFLSPDLLKLIAQHTNLYANAERLLQAQEAQTKGKTLLNARPWQDVTPEEVGAFFGALLLMGCHPRSGPIENYWKECADEPLYPLRSYISQYAFLQIARYLKINHPDEDLKEEDWYNKIEPLGCHFRKVAKQLWTPSSTISIDEVLLQSKGRSKHTLQIDSKAAGEGYKLYIAADEDYCLDFLYSSKATGVAELRTFQPTSALYKTVKNKSFSDSETVVLTLVDRLREAHPSLPFSVVTDNFFTTHKLFSELREWGLGAFGTAKQGTLLPKEFEMLRQCTSKEKNWGERYNLVKDGVNICCYIDMKAVWCFSTVHDFANDPSEWRDAKKRPGASLTHGKPDVSSKVAEEAEEQPLLLPFPQLAVDYNRKMNGADLCAQLWSYYTTANHRHRRNWWPLLWGMLDSMVANTAKICHHLKSDLTHRDIQLQIAYHYLRDPANRLRKRAASASTSGLRPTKIPTLEGQHAWGKTLSWGVKRGNCQGCSRPPGRPWPSRKILGEISGNSRKRCQTGCLQCQVALCGSYCWTEFHSRKNGEL